MEKVTRIIEYLPTHLTSIFSQQSALKGTLYHVILKLKTVENGIKTIKWILARFGPIFTVQTRPIRCKRNDEANPSISRSLSFCISQGTHFDDEHRIDLRFSCHPPTQHSCPRIGNDFLSIQPSLKVWSPKGDQKLEQKICNKLQ